MRTAAGATNCNETVFNNTVISSLDALHAGGSTNIAHATRLGIDVLSNTSGHYGTSRSRTHHDTTD